MKKEAGILSFHFQDEILVLNFLAGNAFKISFAHGRRQGEFHFFA